MSKKQPTEKDPFEKMRQATDALKKANKDAVDGKTPAPKSTKQEPKKKFKNAKAAAAFLAAAGLGLGGAAILTGDTAPDVTEDKSTIEYVNPAPSTPTIDLNDFSLSYDYNYNASPTITPNSSYDFVPYNYYDITPVDPMFESYSPYDNYNPLNPYYRLPY